MTCVPVYIVAHFMAATIIYSTQCCVYLCCNSLGCQSSDCIQLNLFAKSPDTHNTYTGNCFTGLCTKCTGYNNLIITACCSQANVVFVEVLTVYNYTIPYIIQNISSIWYWRCFGIYGIDIVLYVNNQFILSRICELRSIVYLFFNS